MLINDHFVFVHNPKTGGTFVSKMLRKVAEENQNFNIIELPNLKHAGSARIPSEHKQKLLVTNIRNPFDHYVSRYLFRWWADPEYAGTRFCLSIVMKDFPSFPDISFQQFLKLINGHRYRNFKKNEKQVKRAEHLEKMKIGLNTLVFLRMIKSKTFILPQDVDQVINLPLEELWDKFSGIRLLRTHSLNQDLTCFLIDQGIESESVQYILNRDRILPVRGGRSKDNNWQQYYSKNEIDHVIEWDRLIFKLFPEMLPW